MTERLRDKMFDYETTPPEGVWESIAASLDLDKSVLIPNSNTQKANVVSIFNYKFLSIASAAAAILIVCFLIFRKSPATNNNVIEYSSASNNNLGKNKVEEPVNQQKHHDAKLQIPGGDKAETTDSSLLATNLTEPGNEPTEKVNNKTTPEKNEAEDGEKAIKPTIALHSYVTIKDSEGEPVKVSAKIAHLLVSKDASAATDPKWDKKVIEWKKAMLTNTLAATPGNFLDIVELTNTLTDN